MNIDFDKILEAIGGPAVITIIASIISSLIAVIAAIKTAGKEKMNFYSSTISNERINWITVTRELSSNLIAICRVYSKKNLTKEKLLEFEKIRSALLLRLTPNSVIDSFTEEDGTGYYSNDSKLKIMLSQDYEKIQDNIDEIQELVSLVCKNEWNRIKAEAGGNKNVEKTIENYDKSMKKQLKKQYNENHKNDNKKA